MSHKSVAWAFEQKLASGPKFVLVALADFADADNECWPSVKTIVEMTGLGDQTVRAHLQYLEGEGYILRTPRYRDNGSQTSSLYKLSVGGPTENLCTLEPPITNHQENKTDTNVSVNESFTEQCPHCTRKTTKSRIDSHIRVAHQEFYKGRQEGTIRLENRVSEYDSWPDQEDKPKPKSKLNARNLAVDFSDQAKVECGGMTVTNVAALAANISKWHKAGIKYEEIQAVINYFFQIPSKYIWGDTRPWQAFVYKFQQIRKDCDWNDQTERTTYKRFERPNGSRKIIYDS